MNPDYSFFNKSPPSVFSDSFEDDFNERIGSPLGTSLDYLPSDHDSLSGERFFLEDLDLNKDSPPSIGTGTGTGSITVTFAAHHQTTTALPISMSQQFQQPKIKRQEPNMSFSMPTHYSSPFTIPISTTSPTTTTADDSSLDKSNSRKERNRLAAERCRNRRSQMMSNLQMECDKLRQERDKLLRENGMLLEIIRRSSSRKD